MGHVVSKSSRVSPSKHKKDERRIILIGKTGTGKSTLGNAILNKPEFTIKEATNESVTLSCSVGKGTRKDGTNVVVVDTPGMKNTKLKPKDVFEELCKCNAQTKPGPHIFCLTIRGDDRFTPESSETLKELCEFFGEEIYKYMLVVFTHKAEMGKNTSIEDWFWAFPENHHLQQISSFVDNKIAIECIGDTRKQINELFAMIDKIIKRNQGYCYPEEKFKEAVEKFRKRMEEKESLKSRLKDEVSKKTGEAFEYVASQAENVGSKIKAGAVNLINFITKKSS